MASAPFPLVSREGRAKLVPQMKAGGGGGKVSDAWTLALEAKREPRRAAGPEERRYAEWNETERRVRAASKNQHFAVGSWGAQLGPGTGASWEQEGWPGRRSTDGRRQWGRTLSPAVAQISSAPLCSVAQYFLQRKLLDVTWVIALVLNPMIFPGALGKEK